MKNNYLFVIDLDGTLLTKEKKVPFSTRKYLNKINKLGYKVVLASGRPAHNIKKFYNDIGLDTPIIGLNGLHLHHPNNPKLDKCIYFPPKKIKELVKLVSKHFKIKNAINETDTEIYATNKKAYLDPKFWLVNMKLTYGTLDSNLKNPVMTFLMELENRKFNQKKLISLFKGTGCSARCWVDDYQGYVEVFEEHSNKAKAIRTIAKEMKVPINKVYAFGDDLNDIEMLVDIPNAYCMKNAKPNIKKLSHNLTKYDNEHEGVMKEIKRIIKVLKQN